MALAAGTLLGPYEVDALIGAGGMGEVYRARDTRLDRSVALKVLPPAVAADPERRARFEREARTVAQLSHPHICTLHDIGTSNGTTYLVMELLTGETLADRLARGRLPVAQALEIGAQIADALGAAHQAGVVHRDLKPANVMLLRHARGTGKPGSTAAASASDPESGGTHANGGATRRDSRGGDPSDPVYVKLLDFGLAKLSAHGEAPAASMTTLTVTAAAPLTERGTILGTLPYMAPEQVQGQEADARTDIWALGAILYEMVTGTRPFEASSTVSLIGAILEREPAPLATRQPLTPPALERIVARCLAKHPDQRWSSAQDVASELRRTESDRLRGSRSGPLRRLWWASVPLTLALATAIYVWWPPRMSPNTPARPLRVIPLTTLDGVEDTPALSADGEQVAFSWEGERKDNTDIYLKLVGVPEVRRLTDDPGVDAGPSWSPDGKHVAFVRSSPERCAGGRLLVTSSIGGSEMALSTRPLTYPVSWSADGQYVAAGSDFRAHCAPSALAVGIQLFPARGGEARLLTHPEGKTVHHMPAFSPDGRRLAYAACRDWQTSGCDVFVVDLDESLAVKGAARQLTRQLFGAMQGLTWTRDGGSIVFGVEDTAMDYLWRVSAAGKEPPQRVELAGLGAGWPSAARSADRLVFRRDQTDEDIYGFSEGQPVRPVLRSTFSEATPQFSPDGRRVAFCSNRSGESVEVWVAAADGSRARQLTRGPGRHQCTPHWSPDGRTIAFDSVADDRHVHVWLIDGDGGVPRQLTHGGSDQSVPIWSPDGRWVYFRSEWIIWRTRAAGDGSQEQITADKDLAAFLAEEDVDGGGVLYAAFDGSGRPPPALRRQPLGGGPSTVVVPCISGTAFAATVQGIYYAGCGDKTEVHLLNRATGRDRVLGTLDQFQRSRIPSGFAVSPDGGTILYGRLSNSGADLVLIDGFK